MRLPKDLSSLLVLFARLPQQKIAQIVSIFLLVYLAWLFSQLTWQVITPVTQPNAALIKVKQGDSNKNTVTDVKLLTRSHLFGQYQAENKQIKRVEPSVEEAPETRLNLTLTGVAASSDEQVSIAIIENGGKQVTYGLGDKIENTRATLERIYFDRVIIKQSGRMETLMLDGIKFNKTSTTTSAPRSQPVTIDRKKSLDNRNNESVVAKVAELKDAITQDPGKVIDYLRITPHRKNNEIVGYRLMPGKDPDFFAGSGLKPGDIAIQMNGYDLSSPIDAAQALQALKTESEVALLVDRAGEVTEILFSIEN